MRFMATILGALVFSFFSNVALAADGKFTTVKTPRGVSQPFIFAMPDSPKAGVILFIGGDGALGLTNSGRITKSKNNFLARTYKDFVDKGLMVALVDVPSGKKKISAKFRISKKHAGDMIAVIKYMNNQADVPIWMVGTSMGTFSATSVAIKKQKKVSGLILTSTISRSSKKHKSTMEFPNGVLGLNLQKLKMPVLVLAHKKDGCIVTPPADAAKFEGRLSQSPRVEIVMLEGGKTPISAPCHARAQHGFYGIEAEAVARITNFITQ